MSISQNFPEEGPTLNLNFAGSKTLDPRITFSRTTTATYMNDSGLIVTAPADAPRFDHRYVNGEIESLGLLVEEERSNLVTYSSDMSQWSSNGGSFASDDTTAPDGTLTADKLTENNAASNGLWIEVTISANTTYTVASFIKPTDQPRTRIGVYSNVSSWYGNVDTDWDANGEPTTQNSVGASNIKYEPYPNGWYRVSFQFTSPSTINGTIEYFHMPDRTASGKSAWFWGAQLEAGSFMTSLIATSGSTATREPDRAVIEGSNFTDIFNTNFEHFSMFVNYDNTDTDDGTSYFIIQFWGESTNFDNRVEFFKDNASPYHIETRAFGGGSGIFGNGNLTASSKAATQKLATSWSVDYSTSSGASRRWAFSFSGESVDVVNDGTGTTIPSLTRVGFGKNPTRADGFGGKIHFKQISLYSNTLTDSQLQTLTK